MDLDKTEKGILIAGLCITVSWLLLMPSKSLTEEWKDYYHYFDECTSSLSYKTCSEIVHIKDEFDNENNFQQCVEKIGLEKCSLIKKRNEHPKHPIIIEKEQTGPLFRLFSELPILLITGIYISSLLHSLRKRDQLLKEDYDRQIRKLERLLNDRIS